MSKRCGRCLKVKPATEFHRRRKGLQTWCKECRREYDAAYTQRTLARRREQRKKSYAAFSKWYLSLKQGKPCTDCGQVFHPAAMQWDHLPGTDKKADLSNLVRQRNRRRVLDEIAKCELVCANCHAVRTFVRRRGVAQPG